MSDASLLSILKLHYDKGDSFVSRQVLFVQLKESFANSCSVSLSPWVSSDVEPESESIQACFMTLLVVVQLIFIGFSYQTDQIDRATLAVLLLVTSVLCSGFFAA